MKLRQQADTLNVRESHFPLDIYNCKTIGGQGHVALHIVALGPTRLRVLQVTNLLTAL